MEECFCRSRCVSTRTWSSLSLLHSQSKVCLPKDVMLATWTRIDSCENLAFFGGVKWRIVIRSFRLRECPGYLSRCHQRRCLYAPNLHYLPGKLWGQEMEDFGSASIVSTPHEVFVDEDREIVLGVMCGASVADVGYRQVLRAGPRETVE